MEHIWIILMLKILQAHLLRAFVANFNINAIYALYPESFCNKNLPSLMSLLMVLLQIRPDKILGQYGQWFWGDTHPSQPRTPPLQAVVVVIASQIF